MLLAWGPLQVTSGSRFFFQNWHTGLTCTGGWLNCCFLRFFWVWQFVTKSLTVSRNNKNVSSFVFLASCDVKTSARCFQSSQFVDFQDHKKMLPVLCSCFLWCQVPNVFSPLSCWPPRTARMLPALCSLLPVMSGARLMNNISIGMENWKAGTEKVWIWNDFVNNFSGFVWSASHIDPVDWSPNLTRSISNRGSCLKGGIFTNC